jgi:hypothetical protein
MARRSGRASMLVQRRGAAAKKGPREGHVSCVCPYVGVGVVSLTGGIQVFTQRNEGCQRTLATWLHTRGRQRYAGA